MKYIFLIHSHTLFLTALGVIEKEKIPKNKCLFLYSRHYSTPYDECIKTIDISKELEDSFYILFSWSRRHFLYNRRNRNRTVGLFDDLVQREAPDGYLLYAPHLQPFACQILATNPLCKECFFIQEGGRCMFSLLTSHIKWVWRVYNRYIRIIHHEQRLWKMTNWFPNDKTPYNKPIVVYAFDRKYFGRPPKEIRMIKWPKLNTGINIDAKRPIFVTEGAVELGQVEKNVYERALKRLINEFAKQNNYIKFHPRNSKEAKEKYLSYFKDMGVSVEELPMDVPFELILVSYSNLNVYGFGTSLLFYAKALGHHVVSREEYLTQSARYRMYLKGLQTLDEVEAI